MYISILLKHTDIRSRNLYIYISYNHILNTHRMKHDPESQACTLHATSILAHGFWSLHIYALFKPAGLVCQNSHSFFEKKCLDEPPNLNIIYHPIRFPATLKKNNEKHPNSKFLGTVSGSPFRCVISCPVSSAQRLRLGGRRPGRPGRTSHDDMGPKQSSGGHWPTMVSWEIENVKIYADLMMIWG